MAFSVFLIILEGGSPDHLMLILRYCTTLSSPKKQMESKHFKQTERPTCLQTFPLSISKNTNTDNEMVLLPLWLRYLDDNLKFPFKCVITDDFKISNELDVNDIVNLKLISEFYEECY